MYSFYTYPLHLHSFTLFFTSAFNTYILCSCTFYTYTLFYMYSTYICTLDTLPLHIFFSHTPSIPLLYMYCTYFTTVPFTSAFYTHTLYTCAATYHLQVHLPPLHILPLQLLYTHYNCPIHLHPLSLPVSLHQLPLLFPRTYFTPRLYILGICFYTYTLKTCPLPYTLPNCTLHIHCF